MFKTNSKVRIGSINSKNIPKRENGDNYYYVVNFEQTNEKECREFDKTNDAIYSKYLSIYNKIEKQLENCPFNLDKKPTPPKKPNNYEKLIKWRENNIEKNVRIQSLSLLYLISKNYKISLNYEEERISPHEVIKIANTISNNNLDLIIKEGELFQNELEEFFKYKDKMEKEKQNNNNLDNQEEIHINHVSEENLNFGFSGNRQVWNENNSHIQYNTNRESYVYPSIQNNNRESYIYPNINSNNDNNINTNYENVVNAIPSAPLPPQYEGNLDCNSNSNNETKI